MLSHPQRTISRRSFKRSGLTLIEMLVTIALSTAILGVVGTLLHSMLQFDQSTRQEIESSRNLARLSILFRSDAHQAISATRSGDDSMSSPSIIRFLTSSGETIQYRATKAGIQRIKRLDSEVVHRDSFLLNANENVHFELTTFHQRTLAAIVISRSVSIHTPMPRASSEPMENSNPKESPLDLPAPRIISKQTVMRIEAISGLDGGFPVVKNNPSQEKKDGS